MFLSAAVSLLAAPLAAVAQQGGRVYRLGLLSGAPAPAGPAVSLAAEFPGTAAALRALGYEQGRTFVLEARFADGQLDRLPRLAAELVQLRVDLIMARGNRAAHAAKKATATIPVVFSFAADPVETGLVASYARPGANLTGFVAGDFDPKRLEFLKRAVPGAMRIAFLKTPSARPEPVRDAARLLGVQIQVLDVQGPDHLASAFAAAISGHAEAVLVEDGQLFNTSARETAALAAMHKLPAMAAVREFADAGGLLYYGPRPDEGPRQVAAYVDRILKGAKPADLPILRPTTFEFVINLKAAKALGLTIPPSVLAQATEVLQ